MPPIWESDRWYERFGLKESDTGAGFTPDQVAGFKPDKKLLVTYVEAVRMAVNEGLSKMTDDELDRMLNPDNPRLTVGRQIQSVIVGHGFFHLGEIRFLKGLQGMPFPR